MTKRILFAILGMALMMNVFFWLGCSQEITTTTTIDGNNQNSNNEVSKITDLVLPVGFDKNLVVYKESKITVPQLIGTHYVPISKIIDITYNNQNKTDFGNSYASLTYTYDSEELKKKGLIEEFFVFYYDDDKKEWVYVDTAEEDKITKKVTAYTNHLTPFVLTAMPASNGNVADPPFAIYEDFPSGIGGSGSSVFTVIDQNFKYYRDRDYSIKSTTSPQNLTTFTALGFKGAMGIATCNGGSSYGTESQHKTYSGLDYITFTAHMDIDLYLMYDTRGGNNINDISKDAPWLTSLGFTANISTDSNPTPTRYFIETTDAVQYYTVYKKSYLKGDVVHLHGNRNGVTDSNISTNYWIILKRKGVYIEESALNLCTNATNKLPPENVTDLEAITSANGVILRWINPDDPGLKNVIIRRKINSSPTTPMDGDALTGIEFSSTSYRDNGLISNVNYYYTVFSYGYNGVYSTGVTILARTSNSDSDNDGLQNAYEETTIYPTGLKTNKDVSDSDGDGINDGTEVVNQTDPTNPDNTKPVINYFTLISGSSTNNPLLTFNLDASDNTGVAAWFLSLSSLKPSFNSPKWSVSKPVNFSIPDSVGSYTIYVWVKDAAENISDSKSITVVVDKTPPVNPSVSINPTTPTNGNVTVTITYSADSVVKQYKIGSGSYQNYTAPFTVNENTTVYAKGQDAAGNWSGEVNLPISNIDKTAPANPTISINPTTPTTGAVTVTITYSADSTVKQYKIGTGSYQNYTAPFTVNSNTTIFAKGQDSTGNWSGEENLVISNIDKTPPTATVSYSTTSATNGNVTVTIIPSETITVTNNSGLTTYTFTANGTFTFNFTDAAGNTGSATATVSNIDKAAPENPTISINPTTPTTGVVTVTISYSADSTVKQYKIGTGSYQNYTAPFTVSADTTIYARSQDDVGNWSSEINLPITNIDKGTLNVTITLVTPTNQVIDFGTYNGTLNKTISEVLNVTATLTGATLFVWYLDGDALGVTTANCSINSGSYAPGVYNLTVYATKSGVEYSGTIQIKIEN